MQPYLGLYREFSQKENIQWLAGFGVKMPHSSSDKVPRLGWDGKKATVTQITIQYKQFMSKTIYECTTPDATESA